MMSVQYSANHFLDESVVFVEICLVGDATNPTSSLRGQDIIPELVVTNADSNRQHP